MADFLPSLSTFDVERAAQLIQQAYGPSAATASPDDLKRQQQELFEMQKRPEAWGLVIPFLNHDDQNVQFFGAHTAQVKVARDWDTFPNEHAESLRDLLVQLSAHSAAIGRPNFILRKLFVALTSLALKIAPGHPSRWPLWILACVNGFSEHSVSADRIHQFLIIVAEELGSADLVGASKAQMQQSLLDATPMVVQAISSSINRDVPLIQVQAALHTLQAWMNIFPANDLTPFIPILISLLDLAESNEPLFLASSETLQEVLSKSPLSDGAGTKVLTEPLLLWADTVGTAIVNKGDLDELSHSACKLLVALGDHSALYLAANIASQTPITAERTRSQLVHTFLKLMLAYTGLPGYYGVDEDESELILGFWYFFQEALWTTDYEEEEAEDVPPPPRKEPIQVEMAKSAYIDLVQILRRKVAFPPQCGWSKDQLEKFNVYRRDVGDTLINAYYVLRQDMMTFYVNDVVRRLSDPLQDWQEIEATLHCIMSIQEAIEPDAVPELATLFSADVLGKFPTSGHNRLRRTTLSLIGSYSTWFANYSKNTSVVTDSNLLTNVLNYVVTALSDQALCLQAATAFKNICDANRKALAPHIAAFGRLHDNLSNIPDSERSKVLQSISSVIQALPPAEMIPPVEVIVSPIVQKLITAIQNAGILPDEARNAVILQLEILSGIAKGLTRTNESLYYDEESAETVSETEQIKIAREDPRIVKLREDIFVSIRNVVEIWSVDAEISHALSDLFKSITCLPSDTTLLSLDAGPLLETICVAAQRQLTATWLSLAAILIAQLNPPSQSLLTKSVPAKEAQVIVANVLPVLVQCGLTILAPPGAMESNPDIVQEFFSCMDRGAQDFTKVFYTFAPGLLDALIQCAISAMSLQERYSLVSACNFMSNLIHRSSLTQELTTHKNAILASHGRAITGAVLQGIAGVAPRSVVPNLIDMLGTLMSRSTGLEGGAGLIGRWSQEILFADDFVQTKAGPDTKEKFAKAIIASRALKKTREAAQQFALVARGLEGSSFGYASVVGM
ncbi:ARM repeat-containing protein [Coprinopsis marcescibilis]|uniref:ARM repeat-containing protein n=1 Tax=Coprinopsis marcescibilis TaxID=230819 RepID=A0A5C3KI07_COPMA|nr:ARM repeat-containing protein [Coprinopsis marcescibilis]